MIKKNNLFIENISLLDILQDLALTNDKYKSLPIIIFEIFKNKSFLLLYRYTLLLSGNQKKNIYFIQLINRFLNTIKNDEINKLFIKNNWKI